MVHYAPSFGGLSGPGLLRHGAVLAAVALAALEAPFGLAFGTPLSPWQGWVDLAASAALAADLALGAPSGGRARGPGAAAGGPRAAWSRRFLGLADALACAPVAALVLLLPFPPQDGAALAAVHAVRLLRLVRLRKAVSLVRRLPLVPMAVRAPLYAALAGTAVHWIACGWGALHPLPETEGLVEYYIQCLYWAVMTTTTIGYGDILPTDTAGRLYAMLIMVVGVGLYGAVIGNFVQAFAESARLKEQARERLRDIKVLMDHYRIPDGLREAVFGYYGHLMEKRLTDSDQKIISDLPLPLQKELQDHMNVRLIAGLPLFKDCPPECLAEAARALVQEFRAPGEAVVRAGEEGDAMYIVVHGVLDVAAPDGEALATVSEGGFFGEAALLERTVRNADVRARTYCDLYRLGKEEFLGLVSCHRELRGNLERAGRRRNPADGSAPPAG